MLTLLTIMNEEMHSDIYALLPSTCTLKVFLEVESRSHHPILLTILNHFSFFFSFAF